MLEKIAGDSNVSSHTLLLICDNLFNKYRDNIDHEMLLQGLEAAKKGVQLTHSNSPSQLSILAKGYSLVNDPQNAVATIKLAISLAEGELKKALEKDLPNINCR